MKQTRDLRLSCKNRFLRGIYTDVDNSGQARYTQASFQLFVSSQSNRPRMQLNLPSPRRIVMADTQPACPARREVDSRLLIMVTGHRPQVTRFSPTTPTRHRNPGSQSNGHLCAYDESTPTCRVFPCLQILALPLT